MKRLTFFALILLLLLLVACDGGQRQRMEALLDRADSLNRAYVPMTGGLDTLLGEATRYYDRYGTANEQMRAHYLLGCAYRDMGEAPAALQCYQDAIDSADTLSSDCDYRRLMSVYGQMATLYHSQNLPTDELEANCHVQKCAKQLKDTLMYIRSIELRVRPFFLLRDTTSMLSVLKQAQQLYMKNGFYKEASSVYPSIIDIHIKQDNVRKAKELIDIFEAKSGLFDSEGNISPGRESYYYIKGIYYNKVHNLDSAEYYFRKLIPHHLMADAYGGLLSVYQSRMNPDSIVKYVRLYEEAINYEQDALQTQTVHQMSSLYNYQRFLKKADSESRRAERMKYHFLLSVFFIVIVLFVAVVVGINLAHKRKMQAKETERLRQDYAEAVEKKDILGKEIEVLRANREQLMASEQEARNTIETIKSNNRQLLEAKEKEIAELNEKIRKDAIRLLKSSKLEGDSPQFTLLLEDLHKKATRKKNISLPQKADWSQLVSLFSQTQPKAFAVIGRDQKLSTQELRACILLLMKFSNGEIISLLDISHQGMTNIRTRINEKLFGESSATTLPQKLTEISIV